MLSGGTTRGAFSAARVPRMARVMIMAWLRIEVVNHRVLNGSGPEAASISNMDRSTGEATVNLIREE
jgi:hypothetical protein